MPDEASLERCKSQWSRFPNGRLTPLMLKYPRAHSTEIVNFKSPTRHTRDTMLKPQPSRDHTPLYAQYFPA